MRKLKSRGPQLVSEELGLGTGLFSGTKSFAHSPSLNCPLQKHPNSIPQTESVPVFASSASTAPSKCSVYSVFLILHCLVVTYGPEFLKEFEFFKAGPCLIYLGGHGVWHKWKFVELVKRVRM